MTARGEGVRERTALIFMAGVHSLIASRVSCASERKLFFSSARWGWGSERGRGLAVRAVILSVWKKNRLQKSEGCGTVGV